MVHFGVDAVPAQVRDDLRSRLRVAERLLGRRGDRQDDHLARASEQRQGVGDGARGFTAAIERDQHGVADRTRRADVRE